MQCRNVDDVFQVVKDRQVSFIQLWFTDVLGMLKSFSIRPSELEEAMTEGMGFDGSSIEGFARIEESDMIARPDPTTFQLLPWRPQDQPVGRMFCDILEPDGSPYHGDPRYVLKRILARARDKGYTFSVGPELEYFYFANNSEPVILDRGGYFDTTPWTGVTPTAGTPFWPWNKWASGWSTATTKWPTPSTKSTCATTRASRWPTRS